MLILQGHTLRLLSLPDFLDASIGKMMKVTTVVLATGRILWVISDFFHQNASTFKNENPQAHMSFFSS